MVDDTKSQNNNQSNGFTKGQRQYDRMNPQKKKFPRAMASRGHPFYIKPKRLI